MKTLNQKGISTTAIVFIIIVVLLAGGVVWWGVSRNTNINSNQNSNNNFNINGVILETYQNGLYGYSVQYPANWALSDEGDIVNLDNAETNQNIRISVKTKSEDITLLDYILSQTSKADMVEGKYETPTEVTVNGIKGFRVLGEYVGTFIDTYIPLFNTSVIIIGGVYNSARELETINQITDSLRLK